MPVELTEEEIDTAREAAGERSYALVDGLVAALNEAQRLRLQDLVLEWGKVANKFVGISGGKAGVKVDYSQNRAGIRERVRTLLGLPSVKSSAGTKSGTVSVGNEFSF